MSSTWKYAAAVLLLGALSAQAQYMLTKEQMIAYTAGNPFERFADGRPKGSRCDAGESEGNGNRGIVRGRKRRKASRTNSRAIGSYCSPASG